MLTLAELLRDLDVGLLAGEANADAPVRWVHISELLDPTPWLSGGELLLTTGMQLESAKRQREFAARLADHQLAGLGVGTGFAHAQVPAALLKAAADVAGRGEGRRRPDRVRPADAASGGHDRRARDAAPTRGGGDRASPGGRRPVRAGRGGRGRPRARPPAGALRDRRADVRNRA